jgi:CheY-like chemotaxis protein
MKRVLVVDDEDAIRLMLTDVFEAYGYEVTTAANGREALEEVEHHPPAVVVLDAVMPEMDGAAFLREQQRRRELPHVPTLVISGYPERAETAMADLQVDAFLPKPFKLQDLVRLVEQVISAAASREDGRDSRAPGDSGA